MPESTRDRIREVALDVFAERGFEGTATREICARAGVNGAALNYHWRSKEQLWQAVCEQCGGWFGTFIQQVDLTAPPAVAIGTFLRLVFDGLVRDSRPIRVVMWAAIQPHEKDEDGVAQNFRPLVAFADAYLKAQRAIGLVPADVDTEVIAVLMHSMLTYTVVNTRGLRSTFGADLSDPALAARVREAIVAAALHLLGLSAEGPRWPPAAEESPAAPPSRKVRTRSA